MSRLNVVPGIVLLFFLSSSLGLAQSSGSVTIQWGDHPTPPPPPPPGPEYQQPGGPPPHAPAHGYRAKHQYRYYPYQNVYYEPARGMYFFISGNGWAFGASLPGNLTVAGLGTYVSIGLDTDHPYYYNDEHVKKYPKEKYKGNKGKDDDDGPGQGKGKGGKK
jgi:hypothetical protein